MSCNSYPSKWLLLACWGDFTGWRLANYLVHYRESRNGRLKRESERHISSTFAIRNCLERRLKWDIEYKIFIPHSIAVNRYAVNFFSVSSDELCFRQFEEICLRALERGAKEWVDEKRNSNKSVYMYVEEVFKEVIEEKKFSFIPVAFSSFHERKDKPCTLYTFRLNAPLDVCEFFIAYDVYKLLKRGMLNEVGVIIDTTHGINYLTIGFLRGVHLGILLYIIDLLSNGKDDFRVHILHYNSDPVHPFPREGIPSVQLRIVRDEVLTKETFKVFSEVVRIIDQHILSTGSSRISDASEKLASRVAPEGCRKILSSVIKNTALSVRAIARGTPAWAVRIIADTRYGLKSWLRLIIEKILSPRVKIEIFNRASRKEFKFTYRFEYRPNNVLLVVYVLQSFLRHLAENVIVDIKSLSKCLTNDKLKELCGEVNLSKYVAVDYTKLFDGIKDFVEYNINSIVKYSLEDDFKSYFREKKFNVYKVAKDGKGNVRNFYAHAGVYRGSHIVLVQCKKGDKRKLLLVPQLTSEVENWLNNY